MEKKKKKKGRPKGSRNRPVMPVKVLKNSDSELIQIAEKLNRIIAVMNEIETDLQIFKSNPDFRVLIRSDKRKR